MYQPKIRDDLIKRLYETAKAQKIPMTKLVNKLLESSLTNIDTEAKEEQSDYQPNLKNKRGK